jgi:hypothetical protein
MALTAIPTTTTVAASTPDKMIKLGVDVQATIYTCPAGRKFIGQGILSGNTSSTIYIGEGTTGGIQGGSSGGHSFDLYLSAGTSIIAQYAGISGIESDA